ncbi:ester cyclase [Occallatibacter savannae]|uniref:ester cyclase n=1 Tax=Occallatibacter savannae TaxID=1002691 RepID=UPI000D685438|nr:ester cyclase [Occallatibacter savannae]
MVEDSDRACVRQHFQVLWNGGNTERIDEFFSPNFVNFGISYKDARGIIQKIVSVWRNAFPDLQFQIDQMLSSENTVFCEVTLSGTHLGDFVMIPPLQGPTLTPNGRRFQVKHIHRFRLQEGKIVEHFAVRDDLGMFQQLGRIVISE